MYELEERRIENAYYARDMCKETLGLGTIGTM